MKDLGIMRKLFTEQELEDYLVEALNSLQEWLDKKDYSIAAFYSFDIASIYELLGDRENAEHYYKVTLEHLDRAEYPRLWVRVECLCALGKHEEALEAALNDPSHVGQQNTYCT